jgi:hypothetical protein
MPMIQSSIMTDRNVFQWFVLLACQQAVEKQLVQDQVFRQAYRRFRRGIVLESFLNVGMIIFLVGILLFHHQQLIFFCLIWMGGLWRLNFLQRQIVAQIGGKLVPAYVSDYEHKTLFQITEVLGRVFEVPSLTDVQSAVDNISRRALIGAIAVAFVIVPFLLREALIFLILSYAAVVLLKRSPLMMRLLTQNSVDK